MSPFHLLNYGSLTFLGAKKHRCDRNTTSVNSPDLTADQTFPAPPFQLSLSLLLDRSTLIKAVFYKLTIKSQENYWEINGSSQHEEE